MKALIAVSLSVFLVGCAGMRGGRPVIASADLHPTAGNTARGTASFASAAEGVTITAHLFELKPNSLHGFHIHEKGDCSAADGTSAGGHFNPAGRPHGHPGSANHHLGDMPNLRADAKGHATLTYTIRGAALGKGSTDLINRAVIVHGEPDDYTSQPAGNAGPRVACGVIRAGG